MRFLRLSTIVRSCIGATMLLAGLYTHTWVHCFAQNPVGGADQVQPLPGGHAYIGELNETVTPSNGQLSIRIPIPTAEGRQLTIPFSFAYDSNGMWPVTPQWGVSSYLPGSYPGPAPPSTYGVVSFSYGRSNTSDAASDSFSLNGWSYTLPHYSTVVHKSTGTYYGSYACDWLTDFQFYSPTGAGHPLLLGYFSPDNPSLQNMCNQDLNMQVQNYTFGGDNEVRATFSGLYSPTPIVVDSDGTSYFFNPATPTVLTTPEGTANGLATVIEDRNGNQVNLIQNGTSYSYVDTLGRTSLSISGIGGTVDTITSSMLPNPYHVTWETISTNNTANPNLNPLDPNNCASLRLPLGADTRTEVASIILPNGDSYLLSYDPAYGLVSRLTYPSGAYINYTWGVNQQSEQITYKNIFAEGAGGSTGGSAVSSCTAHYDVPAVVERDVSYDGQNVALKQTFSYTTVWGNTQPGVPPLGWVSKTTTETDYDMIAGTTATITYTYSPILAPLDPNTSQLLSTAPNIPVETTVRYGDLMSKTEQWLSPDKKLCEVDTFNGLSKGVFTDDQPYGTAPNIFYGEPDDQRVYDFGSVSPSDCSNFGVLPDGPSSGDTWPQAAPLSKTVTSYQVLTPVLQYPFVQPQTPALPLFLAMPQTVTVTGVGGNQSVTSYAYDTSPVVATPGVYSHDEVNYGTSGTATQTPRGNLTSITRTISSQSSITSSYTYDETGNLLTSTDANGNQPTQITYDPDSYYAYATQIRRPSTSGVNHVTNFVYDHATGRLTQTIDENSEPTNYTYNDPLGRLTSMQGPPVSGQRPTLRYAYTDGTAPSIVATNSVGFQTQTQFDGFGRPSLSTLLSDPQGPVYSLSTYDGEGHVREQWSPSRCNPSSATYCPGEVSFGSSVSSYDQLGRQIAIKNPDASSQHWEYSGNSTVFTDEGANRWTRTNDAFGRLTAVEEPDGISTSYTYDALGNLSGVIQGGGCVKVQSEHGSANPDLIIGPPNPTCSRAPSLSRSFNYDALSRLLWSNNPETGTVCYGTTVGGGPAAANGSNCSSTTGYDANGNLLHKTDSAGSSLITNMMSSTG